MYQTLSAGEKKRKKRLLPILGYGGLAKPWWAGQCLASKLTSPPKREEAKVWSFSGKVAAGYAERGKGFLTGKEGRSPGVSCGQEPGSPPSPLPPP